MYACVSVMAWHVGVCACIGAYMNQCCFFFFLVVFVNQTKPIESAFVCEGV